VSAKRYFIEISYDGTTYHGWQIQPNGITIQECLDKALSICFRQNVVSLGCGRTDAGVHATQFYAHFDIEDIEEQKVLTSLDSVNALLPYSIAVKSVLKVADNAHARFDATARKYHYDIHYTKNPFQLNRSWLYKQKLDVDTMNKAASLLLNFADFSCFSKSHTQTFTNNCKITEARFVETEHGLRFIIQADRFLRNMVRAIVGTLIRIGKGELTEQDLVAIIQSKNRSNAGQSVPACGLYLVAVEYPYIKDEGAMIKE
jgi:tRNA pseudouridine38-40 synthase